MRRSRCIPIIFRIPRADGQYTACRAVPARDGESSVDGIKQFQTSTEWGDTEFWCESDALQISDVNTPLYGNDEMEMLVYPKDYKGYV